METLEDILIPVFICVVLPVMIVWLTTRAATNADNKRAQVLMKAIESNASIDADKLAEALQKPRRTPAEMQSRRLLRGLIFTGLGIVFIIAGQVTQHTSPSPDSLLMSVLAGGACLVVGIAYLGVYYVNGRKPSDTSAADE